MPLIQVPGPGLSMRCRGPEVSETQPLLVREAHVYIIPNLTSTLPGSVLVMVGAGGKEWLAWGWGGASGGLWSQDYAEEFAWVREGFPSRKSSLCKDVCFGDMSR